MNKEDSDASRFWLIACSCVLLGLLCRIYPCGEPLWIDELHTAWVIESDSGVSQSAARGNQTPIYFLTTSAICNFFGLTELSLRLPSMVFGLASILLACRLVWNATRDESLVLMAGTMIATDALLIFWSTEARPYAMLQFFALLQLNGFQRILQNAELQTGPWINFPLVITTAILPLIHLTAVVLIACQILFAICFFRQINAKLVATSLMLSVAILVPLAFPVLQSVLNHRDDWRLFTDSLELLRQTQAMIVPLIVVLTFVQLRGTASKNDLLIPNISIWLLLFSCLGPVLIAVLASQSNMLAIASARYVAAPLMLMPVLLACAIARFFKRPIAIGATAVLIALAVNPVIQNFVTTGEWSSFRTENWKSAVQRIESKSQDRPLIFLFANLIEDGRLANQQAAEFNEYLSFPLTGIYRIEGATVTPMATLISPRWNPINLEQLKNRNDAVIVVRAQQKDFSIITDELRALAQRQGTLLRIEEEFQDNNDVKLAFVSVLN